MRRRFSSAQKKLNCIVQYLLISIYIVFSAEKICNFSPFYSVFLPALALRVKFSLLDILEKDKNCTSKNAGGKV